MDEEIKSRILSIKRYLKYPRKPSRHYFHRAIDKMYSKKALSCIDYCHELKYGELVIIDLPKRIYLRKYIPRKFLTKFEKVFDVRIIRKPNLFGIDYVYYSYHILGYPGHVDIARSFFLYMYHTVRTYGLGLKNYMVHMNRPYKAYQKERVVILVNIHNNILDYWLSKARCNQFSAQSLDSFLTLYRVKRGW